MKKRSLALWMAALMLGLLLCGCGKKADSAGAYDEAGYEPAYAAAVDMSAEAEWEDTDWDDGIYENTAEIPMPEIQGSDKANSAQKLIYTAELDIEATDFDAAAQALTTLTEACGGYYEYSSVWESGSCHYGDYTIRIPAGNYRAFMDSLGGQCHVTSSKEWVEDISDQYYDTAGRLDTQKTKLARLQELLLAAEDMEDIITLEYAISDTEESIDRLSGELRRYDAQVDYSTVTVDLMEVYELTEPEEQHSTFGVRIAAVLATSGEVFLQGMEGILTVLIILVPWLILGGGITALVLVLTRKKRRQRRERKAARGKEERPPLQSTYSTPSPAAEHEKE